MNDLYGNQLNDLLTNPGSYQGSPGYKFALDQGLQATQRGNSSMRGSGNALAELMKYGTGLAQQDYGNQVDRLGKLQGQEQQFSLGQQQNANSAQNNLFNYNLGQTQNANSAQNNFWNYDLGRESNSNNAAMNQNNWNLNSMKYKPNGGGGGNGMSF